MIPNARLQPFVRRGRRVLCSALLAGLALAPGLAPAVAMAAPRDPICAVTLGTPVLNIDDVVQAFEPNDGVGSGVATFNVTLSALPAAGPVSVHFATAPVASSETNGEPATPGSDFVSTSGDLDFRCGEPLTKQIHVTIVDDGLDGDSTHLYEVYQVDLSLPVNAIFGNSVATGEIVDTDALPPPNYCLPPNCRLQPR